MVHPRISDDPFFLIRMEPSRDHPADGLIRFIQIAPLVQRQKHQLAESHQQTVEDYIIENVIFFLFLLSL